MARAWASPGAAADHSAIAGDMRMLGADEETVRERFADDVTEVLEINAPAVRVFLASDTQWRLGPSGAPTGLDYQGMLAAMTMLGIQPCADLLTRLRVLEAEARDVLADRVATEQKRAAAKARQGARRPARGARPRRR